jgi:hypothetical protein
LWGRTICIHPKAEAFDIMLARSGSAPLFLDLSSGFPIHHVVDSFAHLLPCASSFVASGDHILSDKRQHFFIDQELPLLRHLKLAISPRFPTNLIVAPALESSI